LQPANPGDPPNFKKCSKLCPNLFNIKCLIFKGCWKRLIQAASTMALIAGIIVVLVVAIRQGWMKRCMKIIAWCIPKYKGKESNGGRNRDNDAGGDRGQISASGRKRSRFNGAGQGADALEDCDRGAGGDETITPASKKMNSMYTNGGLSLADAATAALAAKQWRHYQQQQISLRQQQQQLAQQQLLEQQQQQEIALENQLIGAYFDSNNSPNISNGGASSSPSTAFPPIPSHMMFYSPETSPGPRVPMMPMIQAPPSSPHLTRAQTVHAHMFTQPQQQQQNNIDTLPRSPLRRWNTFTPHTAEQQPQFTAYNNPLSWQQQLQEQQHTQFAVGSPSAPHFHHPLQQQQGYPQRQQQQQQPASPSCWTVNAVGENNDDMAMTIGPMSSDALHLPPASQQMFVEGAGAGPPPVQATTPSMPNKSDALQDS
jgi:hypothetical protein